jgi:hypothetical protein
LESSHPGFAPWVTGLSVWQSPNSGMPCRLWCAKEQQHPLLKLKLKHTFLVQLSFSPSDSTCPTSFYIPLFYLFSSLHLVCTLCQMSWLYPHWVYLCVFTHCIYAF